MQKNTLVFLSLKDLWDFRQEIYATDMEINTKNKTITCDCSPEHIALALQKYHAKIVETNTGKK